MPKVSHSFLKSAWLVFLVFIGCTLLSVIYQRGGLLHHETQSLILNYIDSRSVLTQVFDVFSNDGGYYQARELSYFFDLIDARFILFSSRLGYPHFISLTYVVSIGLIVLALHYFSTKYLKRVPTTSFLLLASLYLTSPLIFFSSYYFRSAKVLTALFAVLTILLLHKIHRTKKSKSLVYLLLLSTSFLLSISDRQGFFILLSITLLALIATLVHKFKKYAPLALILIASVFLSYTYTYHLGPLLIHSITGESVNLRYLKMDFDSYLDLTYESIGQPNPNTLATRLAQLPGNIRKAFILVLDTASYMFGNIHALFAGILTALATIVLSFRQKRNSNPPGTIAWRKLLLLLSSFALLLTMTVMMVIKHPPILWNDLRRSYYMVPASTFIFFFSIFAWSRFASLYPKKEQLLQFFLCILLGFNILFLPLHREWLTTLSSSPAARIGQNLILCIQERTPKVESYTLTREARLTCARIRAALETEK